MTKPLLAILLLLSFIVGCAETPPKPATSSGSSAGSGKIVTATPEEPFECDDDLILEPHLPEECKPPEPVVQKPVEPPEPDPIVGTYKKFKNNYPNHVSLWRIFPMAQQRWATLGTFGKKKDGEYHFRNANGGNPVYVAKTQSLAGEPDLVTRSPAGVGFTYSDGESIKLSRDPLYSFDFYSLGGNGVQWYCYNNGRGEKGRGYFFLYPGYPKFSADSRRECEALCPDLMSHVYSHPMWQKIKASRKYNRLWLTRPAHRTGDSLFFFSNPAFKCVSRTICISDRRLRPPVPRSRPHPR